MEEGTLGLVGRNLLQSLFSFCDQNDRSSSRDLLSLESIIP
jgi:hypothetical protein